METLVLDKDEVRTPDCYAGTWLLVRKENGDKQMFHVGDVMRMNDFSGFPDAVIAGFDAEGFALLFRPYLYVSSIGTTEPIALTGVERVTRVSPAQLSSNWKRMDDGRKLS